MATVQFCIANYQALMATYNFTNYMKFGSLIEHLPSDQREQFLATITEGHLLARTSLQAALDAADVAAYSFLRWQWCVGLPLRSPEYDAGSLV